ncbi:MAG: choice-of-anchor L domain-containing protein, partial [Rhodospirillaceae bacterium]|nr:choice-of-anchor L domain-containing protein [Rhodospirillaceae bacterium]
TLPLARGDKASLAAYELATRWTGEAHLPVEEGGKTNPKTEAPVETPATEKPIAGLDALNLTGVTLSLEAPGADGPSPASDFEDGALGSWTPGGAVSVLDEKTSTLFPATKEQRYAFLTTGAGSIGGKVSRMTRELTIPASAKELVIDYTLLSQEYPGWVGTIYNDAFVAYVAGDTRFLLVETVTGNQGRWMDFFQPVGNVVESSATVGGVDKKFGGTTGARTKRVPVTGCEGKTITLVLGVSDVGDSIYDTAVAIDRVAFE